MAWFPLHLILWLGCATLLVPVLAGRIMDGSLTGVDALPEGPPSSYENEEIKPESDAMEDTGSDVFREEGDELGLPGLVLPYDSHRGDDDDDDGYDERIGELNKRRLRFHKRRLRFNKRRLRFNKRRLRFYSGARPYSMHSGYFRSPDGIKKSYYPGGMANSRLVSRKRRSPIGSGSEGREGEIVPGMRTKRLSINGDLVALTNMLIKEEQSQRRRRLELLRARLRNLGKRSSELEVVETPGTADMDVAHLIQALRKVVKEDLGVSPLDSL